MTRFVLVPAWFIALAAGSYLLSAYALAPGEEAKPDAYWPNNAHISLHPDKPSLVMFVHPRCPCSRASLGELAILLAQCHGRVQTHVVMVKPQGAEAGWEQTDLLEQAKRIVGVSVLSDTDGALARQFQVQTSGATLLYDKSGELRFCGGITASRGHHGNSDGRQSIADWILNGAANERVTAVFGCPLQNRNTNQQTF